MKAVKQLPQWFIYLSTIPAYFSIYFGLEGLGIINGKYALSSYSNYTYGSQTQTIWLYSFVPTYQMSPYFVIAGLIIVGSVLIRYIKKYGER